MSQFQSTDQVIVDFQDLQVPNKEDGSHCDAPPPAQDQTSQRLSYFSDTSIPLFTLYLRFTEENGRRKYELLKGELDSIIVFCGLFSASVAALIVPSIESGGSTSSDTSSQTNDSQSGPGPQTLTNGEFYLVNLFWIYGLIFSIYCALHALVLQRLTRPPTSVTSPLRHSLPEQARIGVILTRRTERAEKTVRNLQFMVVVSLVVFFLGLGTYLVNVDYITAIIAGILIATYPAYLFCTQAIPHLCDKIKTRWVGSLHHTRSTEERVQGEGSRPDSDILRRTLHMSRSDNDLERFFEAIPGFCASEILDNPRCSLNIGVPQLAEALIGFWNRTLSSNRVSESVKVRRLVVCLRLIESADLSIAVPQFLHLFSRDLSEVSRSLKIGHSLLPLRNGNAASLSRGMIASIISDAERNGRWSMLAMDELDISRDVLRRYLAHGDSVLLANLIHITRHFFDSLPLKKDEVGELLQPHQNFTRETLTILPSVSKFDIRNTLPELQRDFCALWNDLVRRQVQSSSAEGDCFKRILHDIWGLYVVLHGITASEDSLHRDPAASYPLCGDDGHR